MSQTLQQTEHEERRQSRASLGTPWGYFFGGALLDPAWGLLARWTQEALVTGLATLIASHWGYLLGASQKCCN